MLKSKYQVSSAYLSHFLQIISFVLILLYLGAPLFIPLLFGLLVAIITYPACKWLEIKKWPRGLAVFVLILTVVLLFVALLLLLAYEFNFFIQDLPLIKSKLIIYLKQIRIWFSSYFGVLPETQNTIFERFLNDMEYNMSNSLGGMLSATSSTAIRLFLIPVFAALFLIHRGTFVKFLGVMIGERYQGKLASILHESITSYYRFVKGTFFVYCCVGVLNSIGLLILGIEHAILFGMVTAFMSVIPYIGILISAALPVAVALITKNSVMYVVGVISVFSIVQYLEATVIFPKIVGQQLNLSSWGVIVAMIIGTLLWGLSGLILFVPFAAILKIVSDNFVELKAINILLNRSAK